MAVLITLAVLAALYIAFLLWYYGFRKPLSKDQVDRYMIMLGGANVPAQLAPLLENIRKWALADDGKQFFMVNFVRYRDEAEYQDGKDAGISSREANKRYLRSTIPMLLARASHPYGSLHPVAVIRGESWDEVNVVRYRSRKDFLDIITSPRWQAGLSHKDAALSDNPNLPSKGMVAFPFMPLLVLTLFLVIALICLAVTAFGQV